MKPNTKKPDALAPFSEKIKDEYGIKIGEFISQEWFNGTIIGNGCEFMGRRNWVRNKRLYYRAEQDATKYKTIIARQKSDLSWLNLDWRPINIISKFDNIVSNGLSEENYRMDIRATDRYSVLEKKKKILLHKRNMMALPMLEQAVKMGLPDLRPKGYVPEDEDDLAFYTEIKDRPKIEIAEEITVNFVKDLNDWHNIKEECDKDIVQCGLMAAQVYVDPINGVSVRYVDIENAVHSFVKKNDFSDAYYYGYVDTITISEIRKEGNFSETELREIAKAYNTTSNGLHTMDYTTCPFDDIIDLKVDVLRFAWKTSKTINFKKHIQKGKVARVARKEDNWNVSPGGEKSKLSKTYDVWLEGNFVIGTQKLYGYKECENIMKGEINKTKCPFIFRASNIYNNRLHSFQSDIEVLCDQMQYAHLKIQHLLAELKPDMINLDIDALADLGGDTKGASKDESWKEAIAIMQVKGVVLSKRVDMGEEGIKDARSATPMPMSQGSALVTAMNVWAYYYNQVREVTGINPARDGSLPADALLGVNQMAQLASNTVTKHIVRASVDFDKRVCETISSRLKTIYTYKEGKDIQDFYNRAVGKHNLEAMEAMNNRSLHDFGFTVNMVPSNEEIKEFKEDLALAHKEGTIDVEDKIEAQQLVKINLKMANEYLKYKRKKRIKQKMAEDEQRQRLVTEGNNASAKATSDGRINEKVAQAGIDVDKEAKLSQIRIAEKLAMIQIEAPVAEKEFQQDVYLKQLESFTAFDTKKYLEDKKDARIDKQSSQQSKMITQRQENTAPMDFENNFSLDDPIE